MTKRRFSERRAGADRREEPRLALATDLRFLRSGPNGQEVLHGELLDASSTGIQMQLDRPLPLQECILIEIRDDQNRCLNLAAHVVWVEPASAAHRIGCELRKNLTRKQLVLLRQFVRKTESAATP
jgi:hypothetical protein